MNSRVLPTGSDTHHEQVHHMVLGHVAVLGNILHGLWEKEQGYQHGPAAGG